MKDSRITSAKLAIEGALGPKSPPTDPIDTIERARMMRLLRIAVGGIILEVILIAIGLRAPALRLLLRPLYVVVAVGVLITLWHAARKRTGHDRRQADRREDMAER